MSIEGAYAGLCERWGSLGPEERRGLAEGMAVEVTYNSTKLENDEITLHDTESIMRDGELVNYTGALRTVFEVSNHQRAWAAVVKDAFGGNPPEPSVKLLLGMQGMLTEHTYDRARWERGERPRTLKVNDYGVGPGAGVRTGEEFARGLADMASGQARASASRQRSARPRCGRRWRGHWARGRRLCARRTFTRESSTSTRSWTGTGGRRGCFRTTCSSSSGTPRSHRGRRTAWRTTERWTSSTRRAPSTACSRSTRPSH